jgi:hypothetical protein
MEMAQRGNEPALGDGSEMSKGVGFSTMQMLGRNGFFDLVEKTGKSFDKRVWVINNAGRERLGNIFFDVFVRLLSGVDHA